MPVVIVRFDLARENFVPEFGFFELTDFRSVNSADEKDHVESVEMKLAASIIL